MNKKNIGFFLSLAGALACLASCGGDTSSSSSSTQTSSTPSSEPLPPPPSIDEKDFSDLKGTFVGKSGTLNLTNTGLSIDGKLSLDLIPTKAIKLDSVVTDNEGNETTYKIEALEFDSTYNEFAYRAYIDLYGDGFFHLEKEVDGTFATLDTFMPEVGYLSGSYSSFGDSSASNIYDIIDHDFDFDKGVYPCSRYFPLYASYGASNEFYYVSRNRIDTSNIKLPLVVTMEMYDNDDYGYGENIVRAISDEKGTAGYKFGDEDTSSVTDPGALNKQVLFDGTSTVTLEMDAKTKNLTLGGISGVYSTYVDEQGMRVDVKSGEITFSIRIGDHYVTVTNKDVTKVYAYNSVSELVGEFKKDGNTILISEGEEEGSLVTKYNGTTVDTTYVIHNNRKSLKFAVGSTEYIVSPDRLNTSIEVTSNGTKSFFINETLFLNYFVDTMVIHNNKAKLSIVIDENLKATIGTNSGDLALSYWHGQRYPSLVGKVGDKEITIKLIQPNIGYYEITYGDDVFDSFSMATLDKVFGTYSSNYKDRLELDIEKVVIDSKTLSYELKPIYQKGTGTYTFGIQVGEVVYENNLNGCFITNEKSYVKLDVFTSVFGTYSQYAKYGEENIKFLDGKLTLDSVNSSNDGLDKDVEYNYLIMTAGDNSSKAVIAFEYTTNEAGEKVYVYIYFYETYVTIVSQKYYKNGIYNSWGTYADESNSNVVYLQNDSIYYNGNQDFITSWKETEAGLVATSSTRTYTFKDGKVSVKEGEVTLELTRKLTYTDFDKFVGEYTVGEKTFSFVKNEVVGYSLVDGSTKFDLTSMKITGENGKLTLIVSSFSAKYSLSIDLTTNEVTASYDAGLLPPPPPPLP